MITLKNRITRIGFAVLLASLLMLIPMSTIFAASPGNRGQPNQSCQVSLVTPGNAAVAPGSAFNPGGVAGGVYAGSPSNIKDNLHAVSQYDVACFQLTP